MIKLAKIMALVLARGGQRSMDTFAKFYSGKSMNFMKNLFTSTDRVTLCLYSCKTS